MVSPAYLLDQPKPPSPTLVFVNQHIVPRMIDTAAGVETLVARVGSGMRSAPTGPLVVAFCAGALATAFMRRR